MQALEILPIGVGFNALELQLPADLSIDDWAEIGRNLYRSDRQMKWWIGDWARFGLRKYGKLKEFAHAQGLDYQSVANMMWVASSIEVSRRRESVEWSKHAEVAALPPPEQDKWLDKVVESNLPRAELRRQIRQSKGTQNALESDGPITKFISKAFYDLVNWLERKPADFWTEERKAIWRERVERIIKFYETTLKDSA